MPGSITTPAPLVRYPGARGAGGGLVYLLAQIQTPSGWRVRITWAELYADHSGQWRWEVAEVAVGDVERVDGQRYDQVPREHRS